MKSILFSILVLSGMATIARAHVGWTLKECRQHYGKDDQSTDLGTDGSILAYFYCPVFGQKVSIRVTFANGRADATEVEYKRDTERPFQKSWIKKVLEDNVPGAIWSEGPRRTDGTDSTYPDDGLTWKTNGFEGTESNNGRGIYFLRIAAKE